MKYLDPIQFNLMPFDKLPLDLCSIHIYGQVQKNSEQLNIQYNLAGNLSAVQWPTGEVVRTASNLWQHTCFECFVADRDSETYWEYNFSPALLWDRQFFHRYREPDISHPKPLQTPIIKTLEPQKDLKRLIVALPLDHSLQGKKLELGISAVIENLASQHFYFALKHTTDRPDFHARNCFTLSL